MRTGLARRGATYCACSAFVVSTIRIMAFRTSSDRHFSQHLSGHISREDTIPILLGPSIELSNMFSVNLAALGFNLH